MGTNTLQTRSAGETITSDFFNDFNTALQAEFVGRNSSGAATSGQGLGSSSVPWGTGYFNSIVLGGDALDATQITAPANRIVSGSTRSSSNQPYYLKANGSATSVQITGNTTNLVFDVNGSAVTCSTDITISSLTVAPSSNNTALLNMANASDQELTRYWGETPNKYVMRQNNNTVVPFFDYLTIDNVGSEISGLVGKTAAFKINDGSSDEYFIAFVESATKLSNITRGAFLNNVGKPINRIKIANNDTITLMKLTWIFIQNDGTTTDVTYNNPIWSVTQPAGPSTGDYWYDLNVNQWKRYSGSAFVTINRTLLGVCIQDASNCVAARSMDFFYAAKDINNITLDVFSNTNVKAKEKFNSAWVYSNTINFSYETLDWNMTTDLLTTGNNDAYASESASTWYYLYLKDDGGSAISDIGPIFRPDLRGHYHPSNPYLCVGSVYNNSSSNLEGQVVNNKDSLLPATCQWANTVEYNVDGQGSASSGTVDVKPNTFDGDTWFINSYNGTTGESGTNTAFTLLPGVYEFKSQIPLYRTDQSWSYVYDNTAGAVLKRGGNAIGAHGYNGRADSFIYATFEVDAPMEIKIYAFTSNGGGYLGINVGGSGQTEARYSAGTITKIR